MTKYVKLLIEDVTLADLEIIQGNFSAEELGKLRLFCKEADALFDSKLVQEEFPGNLNFSLKPREEWTQENTSTSSGTLLHVDGGIMISLPSGLVKTKISLPEAELWEQFLMRYRPIGLNDEQTNFFSVCKAIKRRLRGPFFNGSMDHQKSVFDGVHMQKNMVKMYTNDHIINSEEFFMIWMNAFYYHRDRSKQELIESVSKILPSDAALFMLISLAKQKCSAIASVKQIAELILTHP